MTTVEEFIALQAQFDREAVAAKASPEAPLRLAEVYRSLTPEERFNIDQEIIKWVTEMNWVRDPNDPEEYQKRYGRYFDAMSLIDEFKIVGARDALKEFRTRTENETGAEIPLEFEIAKIDRVLTDLDIPLER